jgi:hypothetical protein
VVSVASGRVPLGRNVMLLLGGERNENCGTGKLPSCDGWMKNE